jgi:hypothetical protein
MPLCFCTVLLLVQLPADFLLLPSCPAAPPAGPGLTAAPLAAPGPAPPAAPTTRAALAPAPAPDLCLARSPRAQCAATAAAHEAPLAPRAPPRLTAAGPRALRLPARPPPPPLQMPDVWPAAAAGSDSSERCWQQAWTQHCLTQGPAACRLAADSCLQAPACVEATSRTGRRRRRGGSPLLDRPATVTACS